MVPFRKLKCYLSSIYRNWDGDGTVVYGDGWGRGQLFAGMHEDGDDFIPVQHVGWV